MNSEIEVICIKGILQASLHPPPTVKDFHDFGNFFFFTFACQNVLDESLPALSQCYVPVFLSLTKSLFPFLKTIILAFI